MDERIPEGAPVGCLLMTFRPCVACTPVSFLRRAWLLQDQGARGCQASHPEGCRLGGWHGCSRPWQAGADCREHGAVELGFAIMLVALQHIPLK